jgi:hypothetical protein
LGGVRRDWQFFELASSMAIQIHLNKSQLADLKAILELGPEILGAVVDRIDKLEPAPLAPAELQAAIREVVQDNPAVVDSILRQALSLASLQRRRKLEADAVTEIVPLLKKLLHTMQSGTAATSQVETVLESFEGFVDQIEGDTAYVRLKSREHGDVLHGEHSAAVLLAKGIEEQTRFLCRTIKVDGTTRVDMQPVPNGLATDEQLRAIEAKIDKVLPRDDPGIEY